MSAKPPRDAGLLFEQRTLQAAELLYDPALAYHHFGHALRAVARRLRHRRSAGRRPRRSVGAAVPRRGLRHRFPSGRLRIGRGTRGGAGPPRPGRAVPEPLLTEVEQAILAPQRFAAPATVEGQVVRAADLAELAAGFSTFAANSEALRLEQQKLTGAPVPAERWRACCEAVVGGYLDEPLWPLTLPGAVADPRGFHGTARSNLDRYLAELASLRVSRDEC